MDFLLRNANLKNGQRHPNNQNLMFCANYKLWKISGIKENVYIDNPSCTIKIEIMNDFIDTSKVFIREINSQVAKDIIIKNHYTHAWSMCNVALGIFLQHDAEENSFFEGDTETLIGCIIYGNPVGRHASRSISEELAPESVLELTRLWIADLPSCKNIESYALGQSFQWLRQNRPHVKALLSYADNEAGHTGIIYQSTNWLYQGSDALKLMPTFSLSLSKDPYDWIHSRTVMSRWESTNLEHLKKVIGKTFWLKKESSKHRYIYILPTGKDKRRIIKNLKHPTMPYPKTTKFDEQIAEIFVDPSINKVEQNVASFSL